MREPTPSRWAGAPPDASVLPPALLTLTTPARMMPMMSAARLSLETEGAATRRKAARWLFAYHAIVSALRQPAGHMAHLFAPCGDLRLRIAD